MGTIDRLGSTLAASLMLLAPVEASAAKAAPVPHAAIKAKIASLYTVYKRAELPAGHSDDLRPYSARTRGLIAQWRKVLPSDEVTDMADFDWLCQCQDWDPKAFAVTGIIVRRAPGGAYDAAVTYRLDSNSERSLHLIMTFEYGVWKIDDIVFANESPPRALRAALSAELKELRKWPRTSR